MTSLARSILASAAVLVAAGAASAATLSESSVGDFSGDYRTPTVVANGVTSISGTWKGGNDYDIFALTGLKSGAQQVTLKFAPITPIGPTDYSFSAGGTIKYLTTPFKYSAWEGSTLANVIIQHWNRDGNFTYKINLDDGFAGKLFLGLFGTYGSLSYTIDAPGNAAAVITPPPAPVPVPTPALPAPVPLPAGAALLVTGLGALGLAGLRRRRRA